MAFDVREWLRSVEEASRRVRVESAWLASMPSPSSGMAVSSSSDPDRMTPLVERREAASRRLEEASVEVEDARKVFEGMRLIGPMEALAANVMEMRHVELASWTEIGARHGLSRSTCERRREFGIDWLEANGLAHAKAGLGMAAV